MKILKAEKEDVNDIFPLLTKEFSYVKVDYAILLKRLDDENIFIYKITENSKFAGFIDMQILEKGIARINGLAIVDDARGKHLGKTLLEFGIDFLKKRGIESIKLLVKENNETARKLYKDAGFSFIGLHHENIEGAVIEEMELNLSKEKPKGVS
ncbi:MAG: GNAT family N-acetyltransferase [Candidatus Diapherotrites archaeon]